MSCQLWAGGEVRGGDGDGGDGGSLGAEDAGAEGDVGPVVLGEDGHLFRRPAAFGADGEVEAEGGGLMVDVEAVVVKLRGEGSVRFESRGERQLVTLSYLSPLALNFRPYYVLKSQPIIAARRVHRSYPKLYT